MLAQKYRIVYQTGTTMLAVPLAWLILKDALLIRMFRIGSPSLGYPE